MKQGGHNKGKIATRIIAGILVTAMLLGSVATVLVFIFSK